MRDVTNGTVTCIIPQIATVYQSLTCFIKLHKAEMYNKILSKPFHV